MINIAELLRNAPKGMKLYSPLLGEVEFAEVMDTDYVPIRVMKRSYGVRFDEYGRYMGNEYPDSECLLFPSKDCRTWEGWKLPVEPKFKVGDLITNGHCIIQVSSIGYEKINGKLYMMYYHNNDIISVGVESVDKEYHLWTIADAKNGDVLVYQGEIFLFNLVDNNSVLYHCCFDGKLVVHSFYAFSNEESLHVHPATKKQCDLLFKKMKEAGYEWDEKKKELHKIKPHYDIANFKPFDKVLIRVGNKSKWTCDFFSYYDKGFHCIGTDDWSQCIPFEGNEHLLGTTDPCDEQYINW